MIPYLNYRLYCYCCCLLVLLFNDFATTDVSAFNSNAAARVTIRQTALHSSNNIWFDLVEDFFTPSNNNTDNKNYNSKDDALDDFMDLLEEANLGQDLLDEVTMIQNADTAIVELPVMFAGETDDNNNNYNEDSFDFDRWELHRSPQRYFRLLLGIFSGVTTRRIFPTVGFLVAWSALVEFYNAVAVGYGLPEFELPQTPFELAVPVLGLLLVFRSNTAFERFNVGSDATWEITGRFRSIIRQLLSFSAIPGRFDPKERAAAYDLVDACAVLHGWILCDYLRKSNTSQQLRKSSAKQAKILQKSLVLPYDETMQLFTTKTRRTPQHTTEDDALPIPTAPPRQRLRHTPAGLINTVTMGVFTRIPSLDPQESVMIEEQFSQILSSLGTCEKLIRTPIPLGYTRYSVRFLMIWLTLLPLALVRSFSGFATDTWWQGKPQPNLVISMLFLAVAFLSIEDISVQLEEPFSVLPLDLHTKWLKKDYKQMKKTSRLVDRIAIDTEKQLQQEQRQQQQQQQELRQRQQQEQQEQQSTQNEKEGKKRSRFRKWVRDRL